MRKFLSRVWRFITTGGLPIGRHGRVLCWNWLPATCDCSPDCDHSYRYFGYDDFCSQHIEYCFGFWFFHFYTAYD